MTQEQNEALEQGFSYERWEKLDGGKVAVRFVTSWATSEEDAHKLANVLEALA